MKADPPAVVQDGNDEKGEGVVVPDMGISPKDLHTAGWDKHGVWWQPDETIPGLWWYWSEESSWGRWKDQCAALK